VECTMMGGKYAIVYCNSAFQVRFVNLLHPPKIAVNLVAIPGN
jgi:hypothetical protein